MWLGFFLHVEKQFWDEKNPTNAFYRMKQVNWTLIEMSWKVTNWQSYIILIDTSYLALIHRAVLNVGM